MPRRADRILSAIFGRPWLITEEALAGIAEIVEGFGDVDRAALLRDEYESEPNAPSSMAGRGVRIEGTRRASLHGSVAVLEIHGPILRRADMFSEISGATSLEPLANDLHAVAANPVVSDIVLYLNTPGGQVDGPFEFAELVHGLSKPVHVYAGGMMCSAGYLIGAAGKTVTVSETCMVGSIGTVSAYVDEHEKDLREGRRVYHFRSSQSPRKNLDPTTPEGRDAEQALLDSFTTTFIARVAKYRRTGIDNVAENFGQGGVFLGPEAVRRGMADRVGLLHELIAELNQRAASTVPDTHHQHTGENAEAMNETEQPTSGPPAAAPPEPEAPPEPPGTEAATAGPAPVNTPAPAASGVPRETIDMNSEDARLLIQLGEESGAERERRRIRDIFESPPARGMLGDRYFDMIFRQGCDAKEFVYAIAEDENRTAALRRAEFARDAREVETVGDEPSEENEGEAAEEAALLAAALEGAESRKGGRKQ